MMLRTIPRVAIGGSLTLIRMPVDSALRLAGGGASVELALDRAEATVRSLAGFALADEAAEGEALRRLLPRAPELAEASGVTDPEAHVESDRRSLDAPERIRQGRARARRGRPRDRSHPLSQPCPARRARARRSHPAPPC